MDLVHDRAGSMDLVHESGPWTPGPCFVLTRYTAISRKVVGRNVHATIPKGNMGHDQYTVPDTVTVEPTFVALL